MRRFARLGPEARLGATGPVAPQEQLAAEALDLGREEGIAMLVGDGGQAREPEVDLPDPGRRLREEAEAGHAAPDGARLLGQNEQPVELVEPGAGPVGQHVQAGQDRGGVCAKGSLV